VSGFVVWRAKAAIAIHNARLMEEIRYQALHDSLTGLPNRVLLLDRVEQSMARVRRDNVDMALLFIDLDGFKVVNDNMGHKIGDDLLCSVGGALCWNITGVRYRGSARGRRICGVGGRGSLAAGPELVAERLLKVLAEPFRLGV